MQLLFGSKKRIVRKCSEIIDTKTKIADTIDIEIPEIIGAENLDDLAKQQDEFAAMISKKRRVY